MFPEVELHFAETSVTLRCRRDEDFTALLAACEHALQPDNAQGRADAAAAVAAVRRRECFAARAT